MTNIIIYALSILLLIYGYSSVFVYFYATYKGRDLSKKPLFGIKLFNGVFFGIASFFSLTLFFTAGFKGALFFIPNNWGFTDGYGEWVSRKENWSFMLGFITSGVFMAILEKYKQRK